MTVKEIYDLRDYVGSKKPSKAFTMALALKTMKAYRNELRQIERSYAYGQNSNATLEIKALNKAIKQLSK